MDTLALWQKAVPLAEAPLKYLSDADRREWQRVCDPTAIESKLVSAQKELSKPTSGISALSLFGNAFLDAYGPKQSFLRARQSDIKASIASGELLAIGFELPRRLSHSPIVISDQVDNGKYNFQKSEIETPSLKFVEVRVLHSTQASELIPASERQNTTPGRPSYEDAITHAIEELIRGSGIDVGGTAKQHFPSIREKALNYAERNGLDIKTIGDEAIRKRFSPIFKELRRNHKL